MRTLSIRTLIALFILALSLGSLAAQAGPFGKLFGSDDGSFDLGKLAQTLKTTKDAFGKVTEEDELEVGQEAAAVLLGAVPLVDNAPVQQYLNRVGHWVALHTERSHLPWTFGLLESEDINAFAAPGGYVFVTRGLMEQMDSEAELAATISHEVVHVLEKHHLDAVRKGAKMELAISLMGSNSNDEKREKLQRISSGFKELYSRGLSKEDEYQADRMGLVIAARAGYDPYGLPAVLQNLEGMNSQSQSLALMFKTHPTPTQRLGLLAQYYHYIEPFAGQAQVTKRFKKHLAMLKK
jgi:predicted Zn-dependent protease